jgi:hypothetical protein
MSKCPDKAKDLADTQKVLNGKLKAEQGELTWLRHEKRYAGYALDLLLLKGVEDSVLEKTRLSWRQHIDHLRYEHGLEVERDERGYWKITGRSDLNRVRRTYANRENPGKPGDAQRQRWPITDGQYRRGYELGRDIEEGDYTKEEAIEELVRIGTNKVSAANILYITENLLAGKVFKRTLKDEAHGWYLGWILRDFGPEGLEKALEATRLHLAYDLEHGAKRIRLREIVAHFESILKGETPMDAGPDIDNNDARGGKGDELKQAWVKLRYGQPEFRKKVMAAYKGRCAVTGADVERVLEAAHILGYADKGESRVTNGLLLRSDIHALFDAGLLGIDPETGYKVKLSPSLMGSEYWELDGRAIRLPANRDLYPNKEELGRHLRELR